MKRKENDINILRFEPMCVLFLRDHMHHLYASLAIPSNGTNKLSKGDTAQSKQESSLLQRKQMPNRIKNQACMQVVIKTNLQRPLLNRSRHEGNHYILNQATM